jgi:hypothetical protein
MINWKEKGKGLIEFLSENGISIEHRNKVTIQHSDKPDKEVQALIDNYDPIPLAKKEAKNRIKRQSELLMIEIELGYPSFERHTWPYQRLEVESYILDNTSQTPNIDAIALSRGITREDQLQRTISKTNEFKNISNHLSGRRQYFEDLIDVSGDINYINSINFKA